MRARNVFIIFCLILSLVPCFATSSKQTKRKLSYAQVAMYGLVAASVQAVISTVVATYYADLVRTTNPKATSHSNSVARDVLEFVDAKINQELASRGLGQAPLDEVD
ncbi:hypothetical protein BGY98DRAFT_1096878 [Russula aff. rugulosa BPL654]|nr:hypothetical protein BGY98DRAFT_1096878 [Russula aff. rugulosa BPL654]